MATNQKNQGPKRKTVESTFADKWNPVNFGDELAGIYLGSETVKGKRGEPFTVYHLQDQDDKKWSIAGAHLDSIMPQIPLQTFVWVSYVDNQDTANGEMKVYKVDVEDGVELLPAYSGESKK